MKKTVSNNFDADTLMQIMAETNGLDLARFNQKVIAGHLLTAHKMAATLFEAVADENDMASAAVYKAEN